MPGNPNSLLSLLARGPHGLLPPQDPPPHSRQAACVLQLLSFLFLFFLPSWTHPGRRPGVTANQQKPEQVSLALSPLATPAEGQPGVLTRPEHKGGSSGKPGDRVPQSCSPCLSQVPPSLCLLGKPSCLQAVLGSWGTLGFPSLCRGCPPCDRIRPSSAVSGSVTPFGIIS